MKTIGRAYEAMLQQIERNNQIAEAESARIKAEFDALPEDEKQRILQENAEREKRERIKIAEAEKRKEEAERIAWLEKKHIPPRYFDATWDNWTADTPEKQKALTMAKQAWDKNLLFSGEPGTGKTHLAVCLTKDGATFRKLYEIFDEVRHDMDNDTEIIDWYAKCKLLILDEVGRQKFSDFALETFFKLIDKRWDNMLPTTLITNLEPRELAAIYGVAALDRLKPEIVKFNWKGMR